ncbi:MAG: trypsin-like peptidase domain-containing protein, partial [Iamia sp.]
MPPAAPAATPPWGAGDPVWARTDPGAPPIGPSSVPPDRVGPPPPHRRWARVAVLAAVGLLSAGSFVAGQALRDDPSPAAVAATPSAASSATVPGVADAEEPVAAVAAALSPTVVQIETGTGLGSGFVYDADAGLIMTAAHVIDGSSDVTLRLADGRTSDGTGVGADDGTAIAVVQTEAEGLPAAALALDEPAEVGQ